MPDEVIIGITIIAAFIIFVLSVATEDHISTAWKTFNRSPAKIHTNQGAYDSYQTIYMSFRRWRELFELHPTTFAFIESKSGRKIDLKQPQLYVFYATHPAYYVEEEDQFYVINFRFVDFLKYRLYNREIQDRISSIGEDKITQYIIGDVQTKLDKIVAESQSQIEKSLNLQKEIVLRMQGDNSNQTEGR